jgi:hypothetical protein
MAREARFHEFLVAAFSVTSEVAISPTAGAGVFGGVLIMN